MGDKSVTACVPSVATKAFSEREYVKSIRSQILNATQSLNL